MTQSKMEVVLFLSLFLLHTVLGSETIEIPNSLPCTANSRQIVSNSSNSNIWPWQTYQSSNATPPLLLIERTGEPLYDGLLIFDLALGSAVPATKGLGPLIMTDSGDLVWNGPEVAGNNLRVQHLNKSPVLTYFSGQGTAGASAVVGHGYGEVIILDTEYKIITTVCPKLENFVMETGVSARCHGDLHESMITPRNTMLITAYNTTRADLTSVGGPQDGWILDSLALEVNISTGEIIFQWSPLTHLPINQSHASLGTQGVNQSDPYDFFHINAIQLVGENYLINSRHYWSTFLVNPQGEILWEINGLTGGDFGALPEGGTFSWQHFARVQEISPTHITVSWFGNNNETPNLNTTTPSVGVTLEMTLPPNPASPPILLTNLTNPDLRVDAWSQGSFSRLPNGNMLMGYGSEAVMVEYGPVIRGTTEATPRWSANFGYGDLVSSYRVYKQEWHATPSTKPNLVVVEAKTNDNLHCAGTSTHRGFVSWNGATDVTEWIVYAGRTNESLFPVARAKKTGFETEFAVPNNISFVQVGAIEKNSRDIVRKSEVVRVESSF